MVKMNIEYIHKKEMRNMINTIKSYGLNENGIIFGGLVRDEIIATHYRSLFFEKNLDKSKYWNEKYNSETLHRLLIPNDMDIYFNNENNKNLFLERLNTFVNVFNGNMYSISRNSDKFKYISDDISFNHSKIMIYLLVGKTMKFRGFTLKFSIDIITNNSSKNIEPPFYNVDFLSNSFIMEKVNGIIHTRISNCTGTPIDNMNFSNKMRFTNQIITDIINLKTYFTRNIYSINRENINCNRIIKMIEKENIKWNIANLPFKIYMNNDKLIDIDIDINERCCICLEDVNFKSSNKIVEINTNKNKGYILHFKCFLNYLRKEQYNKHFNQETGENDCRCPFRNPFNFRDCYKLVDYK
jgi:hypothetical protein